MDKKNNRGHAFEEQDEFWKLDALIPERRHIPQRSLDVTATDVFFGSDGENNITPEVEKISNPNANSESGESVTKPDIESNKSTAYPPITSSGGERLDFEEWVKRKYQAISEERNKLVCEYVPKTPLITLVRISKQQTFGRAAERMLSDMEAMYEVDVEFTKNVSFTAFYPQYATMTPEQTHCYLGFRTEVRNGHFPAVDESYIYLLLYEIINLGDKIPPIKGVDLICSLMNAYRDCSDRLFANMCDWLADLCLINQLEAPFSRLEEVCERVYKLARWKEFFIPFDLEHISADACVLLNCASSYDYRKSRYYTNKTAAVFEKHLPAAFDAAISGISLIDKSFSNSRKETTRLIHEAFRGSLCSQSAKRMISIDCVCLTRSPLVKQTVTALVKFAENYIRELIGVKSRLTINYLGTDRKKYITEYFEPFIRRTYENEKTASDGSSTANTKDISELKRELAEYEKYYEPQSDEFSLSRAAEIEKASWKTTDMLLHAFEGEAEEETERPSEAAVIPDNNALQASHFEASDNRSSVTATAEENGIGSSLKASDQRRAGSGDIAIEALRSLLCGKLTEFREIAASNNMLLETLADMINERALESYGDIGVEIDENGIPHLIEDYRNELEMLAENF